MNDETETTADPIPTEPSVAEALDAGIAEASEPAQPEPVTEPEADASDGDTPEPTADGETKPEELDAAQPEAATEPADAKAEPKPEPERDEAMEKEIASLSLKKDSAERFREMAGEIKTFAPIKDALGKAGIQDAAAFAERVPQLLRHSQDLEDMVGMVTQTGASAEQYDMALKYLGDVHKAAQGDVAAAQRAYERAAQEVAVFAKMLGKDGAGVDPLAEHQDLASDVESGELSRQRALEIAAARNQGKMNEAYRTQTTQVASHEQAWETGKQALNALGVEWAKTDPDYARKKPFLMATLETIVQSLPPEQWATATRAAYARIPAMPKPEPHKPPPGPMRTSGPRPVLAAVTDDPLEAMNQGIAAASG